MAVDLKHKILVIDDCRIMRKIVTDVLSQQKYEVMSLDCTKDAIDVLGRETISLILLDVDMPGEDGYQFITRLKKHQELEDIPVIFMTGMDGLEDKVQGFELGAVDYIVKPFHGMDVVMRVKSQLKLYEVHLKQKLKLQQISNAHTSHMKKPEDLPRARFGIYFQSFEEAGGDFYDVVDLEKVGSYAYFVADISGHDIATSYVMPAVKTLLLEMFKSSDELKDKLDKFNQSVTELLPDGKFITAQLLIVDRAAGNATLVNMGHTPLIYMASGEKAISVECPGDILGIHSDPEFGYKEFNIGPYDRFIMYSDGLLESYDARQVWTERVEYLAEKVTETANAEVNDLGELLVSDLLAGEGASDDIVIMSIDI